ncbi:MAG TPA: hypothetical protein VE075_10460 [Thermoanaerobaculia bacterium]|nr:hypothetical protein [Thermoanaerobaculia bacterium]
MFPVVSRPAGGRGAWQRLAWALGLLACRALRPDAAAAQERPYLITYDRQLEEPGNLEIAIDPLLARQRGGGDFLASAIELEYGVKAWWTTELYVDGQATSGDGAVATGWRWENRVRPLLREHWVNPVLYVELEDITDADKTLLEVVGHDVEGDHAAPNRLTRRDRKRELEAKLILSSSLGDWDLSENLIAEKDLAGAAWEFGYAVGLARPLALAARPDACSFCRENFTAGIEMYGGLGDAEQFGLKDTSHYLGPVIAWNLPGGTTLRLSPTFGLNRNSHRFLLRLGVSYEVPGFAYRLRDALRDGPRGGAPGEPPGEPRAGGGR